MTDARPPTATRGRAARRRPQPLPLWLETVLLLAVAVGAGHPDQGVLRPGVLHPVARRWSRGLVKNDRILVEKPSYWFGGTPQRGDVVVFKDPGGWLSEAEDAGPSNPIGKAMVKIGLYPPAATS